MSAPAAPAATAYRVAQGQRIYAVGDVHGRADLLEDLLGKMKKEKQGIDAQNILVVLGDVIDRGAASREAVELVRAAEADFDQLVLLRGNHEQALLNFLENPKAEPAWLGIGGDVAAESYGVPVRNSGGFARSPEAIAAELDLVMQELGHKEFIQKSALYWENGGYLFVHAGVRRGVPLPHQLPEDLIMIREHFAGQPHGLPCRIVHGHHVFDTPRVEDDRIGIDTGAYRTGVLTCAVLEDDSVRFLQTGAAAGSMNA